MKRFPLIGTLLLIPAMALFLATVGCNKEAEKKTTEPKKTEEVKKKDKTKIAGETVGTLTGVVKFDGTAPEAKPNAGIAGHKEAAQCNAAKNKTDLLDQTWLVNKDGGVANVVISLVPADDKEFAGGVDRKGNVEIDQPFCAYIPHVVALQAGAQKLLVKNTGTMNHNTKITSNPKFNEPTDDPVGAGKALEPRAFKFEPTPINIACSMHSFMSAKLVTFEHPYFAVTDSKGAFSIANIPVGEKLTVYVWHESMGDKGQSRQEITFEKGKAQSIELKIK